ncbi:PREDICTED: serine/threonine-protein phosphatase rdgC-like, partial [Rhagoletis zephyria]|uniref:serine/threonine-protein phosphatase rdgC-like n=1 Tax=Rhagoletis zephyria TaxID=28612 RepID=UPI0008114AB1
MDAQCKLLPKLKLSFNVMGCLSGKQKHADSATTLRAALLIQRWYRRYRARMEVRRRYTWNIFTSLEYAGENDQVELYNFFNALLTHIPEAAASHRPSIQKDSEISLASDVYFDESDFNEDGEYRSDKNYDGPHIKFPLIKKDIVTLIDLFRKKKRNAEKLMIMIEEVYRWLPLGTIVNNRVLIVHGGISDTTDLDMIKSIDRGKRNAEKLMIMIEEVYRWLPLGTIVNNRVLIVHGGISDTTDLDMIKSIDRGK